jgi:O-antigen/teichoic acid export membrane protein
MVFLLARQLAFFIGETSIPSLVHYHAIGDAGQFSRTMRHVWRYTNIVVLGAAMLVLCYAGPLVTVVVGGAFLKTAVLIKLLVPAFVATTLTLCVRIALFAREKSLRLLVSHGGALLAFTAIMAGIWFSGKSITSESIAVVFSISCVLGFALMAFRSGTRVPPGELMLSVLKPLVAAAVVWQGLHALDLQGHMLLLSAPLALAAYMAVLLAVRGLEVRDWHRVLELTGRRTSENGDQTI